MTEYSAPAPGMQSAMAILPGMQSAMAILTARLQSMDGGCTVAEYVSLLRSEMANEDPLIVTSALASLASALLSIAAGGTHIPQYELLSTIGLTLAAA